VIVSIFKSDGGASGGQSSDVQQHAAVFPCVPVGDSPTAQALDDVGQGDDRGDEIRDVRPRVTRRGDDRADEVCTGYARDFDNQVDRDAILLGTGEPAPQRHSPVNPSVGVAGEGGEGHEASSPAGVTSHQVDRRQGGWRTTRRQAGLRQRQGPTGLAPERKTISPRTAPEQARPHSDVTGRTARKKHTSRRRPFGSGSGPDQCRSRPKADLSNPLPSVELSAWPWPGPSD
jgi:hypothetical protein